MLPAMAVAAASNIFFFSRAFLCAILNGESCGRIMSAGSVCRLLVRV